MPDLRVTVRSNTGAPLAGVRVDTTLVPQSTLRRASQLSTWTELGLSGFPTSQSVINIPGGHPGLLLDVDTLTFRDLIHSSTIRDAEGFRTLLRIGRNLAGHAGEVQFGHSDFLRLEWPSVNDALVVGGQTSVELPSDPGWWVLHGCRLNFARRPELSWTRLTVALAAGQTAFDLPEDPVGWGAGTELFIAAMTPPNVTGYADRWERAVVQSVSGRRITLTAPLRWDHLIATHAPTGRSFGAEVVKLNERITMETLSGGAHMYIHTMDVVHYCEGLRMIRCGPVGTNGLGVLARWGGVHPHHATNGAGSQFVRHKIDRARSNGLFFHASHGFQAIDSFALETMVDGNFHTSGPFMWDPDVGASQVNSSNDVLWRRCGAAVVYRPAAASSFVQRQGGFVMSKGFRCVIEDSFATSCAGRFQMAGLHYPEGTFGVWTIRRFVGHNNERGRSDWWNEQHQSRPQSPHVSEDEVYFWNNIGHFHGAYGNSAAFRRPLIFANRTVGFEQHAQGSDPAEAFPASIHTNGFIDAAPFSGKAYVSTSHQSAQNWVTFDGFTFRGPVEIIKRFGFADRDGPLVGSDMGAPDMLRFVRTNWMNGAFPRMPDVRVNANGSTNTRIPNTSRWQIQPDPRTSTGAVELTPAHVDPRTNQPTVSIPAGSVFVRAWGAFVRPIAPFA